VTCGVIGHHHVKGFVAAQNLTQSERQLASPLTVLLSGHTTETAEASFGTSGSSTAFYGAAEGNVRVPGQVDFIRPMKFDVYRTSLRLEHVHMNINAYFYRYGHDCGVNWYVNLGSSSLLYGLGARDTGESERAG